ncbi:peptidase inhibitor family I36 protein [Kribbella catacumbae]|uniref:peptidase inhibitor family I36 protein n=1 Tax=Kribbella catacumbae TaxID=460086 RepID=UPI00036783B8|nr:peptidase inhibitor family I36 protein [Kribbella catacumbae]
MNIRRTLTSAALATGLGAAVLVAAPATQANADWYQCAAGKFCLFHYADGGDSPFTDGVAPIWHQDLHSIGFGDWAWSVWNRTGAYICVYQHHNYNRGEQGWSRKIPPATHPDAAQNFFSRIVSSYSVVNAGDSCDKPLAPR